MQERPLMENQINLYARLAESYSDVNLNRITVKLIELYKSKNHSQLFGLANKISKYIPLDTEKISRCFSGLVMLYHPDKGEYYRKMILQFRNDNNLAGLESYSHIFLLDNLEVLPISSSVISEDIEYNPEYRWDDSQSGYSYINESDSTTDDNTPPEFEYENTFYNIVKLRMYGTLEIEFPSHYLEDFEDVEFAESQIDFLDGIEHCKHATVIDLTGNNITDISLLWNLERLEEIYLADNQIGIIDTLGNLTNLRVIDVSGNEIDDLSALYGLGKLEYLNVIGNTIPIDQIEKLKENEILVMH